MRRGDRAAEVDTLAAALRDVGHVVVPELLTVSAVEELRAAFGLATPGSTSHAAVDPSPAR